MPGDIKRRGSERAEEKRDWAEELFLYGALPASRGKKASRLFMEADGCMISLQREQRRKHGLKTGISYEGFERVSEDKWRTKERRVFLSAADGGTFFSLWSADLATVYDHSGVGEIIWSSDGASWLAPGPDLFSLTHAQLSRFHLKRSLARALGFSPEAQRLFSLACEGKGKEAVEALEDHLKKAADEGERKRVSEAASYISSLSSWLLDWRKVLPSQEEDRSPGAIEGNVDKLISCRFKKRGMSWRPAGADHMCQVIEIRENGELGTFLSKKEGGRKKSPRGHVILAEGGEKESGGLAQEAYAAARVEKRRSLGQGHPQGPCGLRQNGVLRFCRDGVPTFSGQQLEQDTNLT